MEHLNKLTKHGLVIGLPKIKFVKDKLRDACQKGKKLDQLSNLRMWCLLQGH